MDGNYYGMRTTATNDTVTIGNTAGLGDQYFIVTQKGGDEQIELNSQYKINIHTNTLAFLFNNSTQTAIFSDNSEVPLGIQYEGNYTSSFTTSSLIDRRYADKHIAFSSSAAATSASLISGRGGIYNGSGVIPSQTTASVNYTGTGGVTYTGSLMFFGRSPYDNLKGYNVRRFGFHNHVTGSAYGFAGFVSNSGSAFAALSAVSQSITQECKFEVSPQKITFYSESGSNRGTIEFNLNDGLKYLTVPPPLTKYSLAHKDYVDDRSLGGVS